MLASGRSHGRRSRRFAKAIGVAVDIAQARGQQHLIQPGEPQQSQHARRNPTEHQRAPGREQPRVGGYQNVEAGAVEERHRTDIQTNEPPSSRLVRPKILDERVGTSEIPLAHRANKRRVRSFRSVVNDALLPETPARCVDDGGMDASMGNSLRSCTEDAATV